MSSYGGYNQYPLQPGMYGAQPLITNYPASNYYNGGMIGGGVGGYYPNTGGYVAQGYGGVYGNTYGGGYGGYGMNGYPYKQSTLRTIYNRLRHGSSYGNYPYYNQSGYPQQMGYEYGRHHRGSYIDYN